MVAFDVSPLVPEARSIAAAAAEVLLRHTEPWFVGLLAHGSAFKGGYIPGSSDVDFQLYLEPSAFSEDSALPFELNAAIHRDLAAINPYPFSYIQCYAHPCALPADQVGPIPGAYTLLAGRLPVPEATGTDLLRSARRALSQLHPVPDYLRDGLLNHGAGRLQRHTRVICTDVWPLLYEVLTLREEEMALAIWRLPKPDAIARLPRADPLGRAIRAFDTAVRTYYPEQTSVDAALDVLRTGIVFRRSVAEWWCRAHGNRTHDTNPGEHPVLADPS